MLITLDIAESEKTEPIDVAQAVIKLEQSWGNDYLVETSRLLEIAGHIKLYAEHKLAIKDY